MTETSHVRVRFAPSPTGMLHIGGVRTALYNYLWARKHGGKFLLRIENTDTTREVRRAVSQIQDSLRWIGLDWDGEATFQLDSAERCRELAHALVAAGKAYEDEGAIRFRMPDEGTTGWDDLIKGRLEFANAEIADMVILRADGRPTYNFASPVDDILDGITHVIRGDDHVSNTPKQINILRALAEISGGEIPHYAHLPMVAGNDGKKLSKRHGAVGIEEFRAAGYLPEALVNFLALVGWAPGNGETQEFFTLAELVDAFDLAGVGEAMSRFDYEKLTWMNAHYLRAVPAAEFPGLLYSYLKDEGYAWDCETVLAAAPLCQEKIETLGAFPGFAGYFFSRPEPWYPDGEQTLPILLAAEDELEAIDEDTFTVETVEAALRGVCAALDLKPREGFRPIFGAITGSKVGASLFHSIALLGRSETLKRLRAAAKPLEDALREAEAKERKAGKKDYRS